MNIKPMLSVVDNFLDNPDALRALALDQNYVTNDGYKGRRSTHQFLDTVDITDFEKILGRRIIAWGRHQMNARFQVCIGGEQLVYHSDSQSHAAVIFLTPDAPVESGLSLFKSRVTGVRRAPDDSDTEARTYGNGNVLDPTKWDEVDRIGNVYNRLVLWDGRMIHSASCYFGNTIDTGRLFQIFFFDAE